MEVALVYDRVNKWGGAERVLLALHELFPDAPLYTSVYNPELAPWAKAFPKVYSSFLQSFPLAKTRHELYPIFMPIAFESFTFDDYDLVISVTSEAAKGILTKPQTMHVCYCLTPTRYLWSGYDDYFSNSFFRTITKPAISYLRSWDKIAGQRPDRYIAISKEVQKRIKTYYGRESEVVYPPVHLKVPRVSRGDYFLIVSRLVPYKRIDIAIDSFNKLGLPLKIIGTGSEFNKLKSRAKDNIEFLGNLTDREVAGYYEDCIALITPGIEDFGLSSVEAGSFGKPVIAFKGGGLREIVKEGVTGEFFSPQTSDALMDVLRKFDAKKYLPELCKERAKQFSLQIFKEKFMEFIKRI